VSPPNAQKESLLVFSDVHLGSDLNDRAAPGERPHRTERIDRDLVDFLAHYAAEEPAGDRWRIVIAGDFIDFIGMTVEPEGPLVTELTSEEREHGLGNASDHARAKLRRVVRRHPDVFEALGSFVARGHALSVVHGNHDLELHWDGVREDFRAALADGARRAGHDVDDAELAERVEFAAWFFYRDGVAYIEHGHQYDEYCATDLPMAPLSPLDPRRMMRGFSDILLRYVVRPTRGMREHGHETLGVVDYLTFGAKLGFGGMLRLGGRFYDAVVELFRLRRAHLSSATRTLREEHERRMGLLAEATRIGVDRLRAIAALQSPPVTRSIRGILASVLLDRLALALLSSILLFVTALVGFRYGHAFWASACIAIAWVSAHRHLAKQRQLDPAEQMADRANHLVRLLPAAFVVMGHTHAPVEKTLDGGDATYINLGSWAEEEPETDGAPSPPATRTHLVIHVRDGRAEAELRAWEPGGPRRFIAG
jgi:UDP-2,3-diacylglucosamine pyrophosphatase LpxH